MEQKIIELTKVLIEEGYKANITYEVDDKKKCVIFRKVITKPIIDAGELEEILKNVKFLKIKCLTFCPDGYWMGAGKLCFKLNDLNKEIIIKNLRAIIDVSFEEE